MRHAALASLPLIAAAAAAGLLGAAPARAEVVAMAKMENGQLELRNDRGPCVKEARQAVYVGNDGERIDGCYSVHPMGVFVVFMDGEISRIPRQLLRKPDGT